MRAPLALFLSALTGLLASPALADDGWTDLELTLPATLSERTATGSGEALGGYGYDAQSGLSAGADARLYYGFNRYFAVGPMVAGAHQAGAMMGAVDGHAFRLTTMDAGLAARTLFPCMSGGDIRVHMSGILAVSGVHADAGLGNGGQDNGPDLAVRRDASESLDHAGLGWRFGLDLAVHVQNFVIGGGLGVRQYFGIDSPVARGWTMDVGMRVGGRIDFEGRQPVGL
ncbi:MAG: hypothetical protein AB8I08_38175 [Sandaracinaceae bacterium]